MDLNGELMWLRLRRVECSVGMREKRESGVGVLTRYFCTTALRKN